MNIQNNINHLITSVLVLLIILLAGCSNNNEQLPPGSSVDVAPNERVITITELRDENNVCIWDDDQYLDTPVSIRVLNGNGSPVGDKEIAVYVDWSGNTFPGVQALKLYDDLNGNGVVDDPEELVSGDGDAIFTTETSEFSGERVVLLRMNLSCGYLGSLFALADGNVGSMQIDVVADNEDAP